MCTLKSTIVICTRYYSPLAVLCHPSGSSEVEFAVFWPSSYHKWLYTHTHTHAHSHADINTLGEQTQPRCAECEKTPITRKPTGNERKLRLFLVILKKQHWRYQNMKLETFQVSFMHQWSYIESGWGGWQHSICLSVSDGKHNYSAGTFSQAIWSCQFPFRDVMQHQKWDGH